MIVESGESREAKKSSQGFSLLELSIVIAVIALISGTVVLGNELLEQSKMRKVAKDMNVYQTAYISFISDYGGIPGDFSTASTRSPGCSKTGQSGILCNGNGDGVVGYNNETASNGDEDLLVWGHLASAKLIQGQFNSRATTAPPYAQGGINVPGGAVSGSVFEIYQQSEYDALGHYLRFGLPSSEISSGYYIQDGVISPRDAESLDKKMDDGFAARGMLMTIRGTSVWSDSVCVSGQSGVDPAGSVNFILTDQTKSCALLLRLDPLSTMF